MLDSRKQSFGCPVCVTNSYIYKGMRVNFKMSLEEPSTAVPYIYEFVYQPDGSLTEDWAGKKKIEVKYQNAVLGAGEVRRLAPPKLSEEARAARAPRPPEELVGALQDRIHPTSGRLLAASRSRPPGGAVGGCSTSNMKPKSKKSIHPSGSCGSVGGGGSCGGGGCGS